MNNNKVDVIIGSQFGDEGKGAVVDMFVQKFLYELIIRFQGGCNAGHTIVTPKGKLVLHQIPSGYPSGLTCLIGDGVVLSPFKLFQEIEQVSNLYPNLDPHKLIMIGNLTKITTPFHRWIDKAQEEGRTQKIGTTLSGIGPTYDSWNNRRGICMRDIHNSKRFNELCMKEAGHAMSILKTLPEVSFDINDEVAQFMKSIEELRKFKTVDCNTFINTYLSQGKKVLAEGAQGSMLDINVGTRPYVTSSMTTVSGVLAGLGINHSQIGTVTAVTKAYLTRVGKGPFPTELKCETGQHIAFKGNEFGATTGRPRRCGWISLPELRYANAINGISQYVVTKMDVFDELDRLKVCNAYRFDQSENPWNDYMPKYMTGLDLRDVKPENLEFKHFDGWRKDTTEITNKSDLPQEFRSYIDIVFNEMLNIPVFAVKNGPERDAFILWNE